MTSRRSDKVSSKEESVELADFFPLYPDQDDNKFQAKIAAKAEFIELASERKETPKSWPDLKSRYFKHQIAFSRFMRVYDTCFLYGETGIGKTGMFAKVARFFQAHPEYGYKRAIFITANSILKDEFRRQLQCQFGPEEGAEKGKSRRGVDAWFYITTYRAFAGLLYRKYYVDGKWRYDNLVKDYDHSIIFLDEAHKLRKENMEKTEKKEDQKVLGIVETRNIFQDIFPRLTFSKIILASGTPMINDPKDLIDIVNLILSKPMPADFDFDKAQVKDLVPYLNGRICYIKAMDTGINKVIEGEDVKYNGITFRVYQVNMSPFQYEVYKSYTKQAKTVDNEEDDEDDEKPVADTEKADSFISRARQAATFVFPDGKLGRFNHYFRAYVEGEKKRGRRRKGEIQAFTRYEFTDAFLDYFAEYLDLDMTGMSEEEKFSYLVDSVSAEDKIDAIRNLSTIFAEIIMIETNPKTKGCAFINDIRTKASGVVILGKLLELFGFEPFEEVVSVVETEESKDGICQSRGHIRPSFKKKLRYALLTSETPDVMRKYMFDTWNHPDNYMGEYISIFITSPTGETGINLNHVLRIYNIPLPWNRSSQHQTETRAIRATSHQVLLENLQKTKIDVHIYYMYAAGSDGEETIGLKMYYNSAVKDQRIKRVERMLQQLAYNAIYDMKHNEVEDPINVKTVLPIDYSSADTLYAKDYFPGALTVIEKAYKEQGYYHSYELKDLLKDFRPAIIAQAIDYYLHSNRPIMNRLDFPGLLREDNGVYYLDHDTNPTKGKGKGFYDQTILTQEVKMSAFDISQEEVKEIVAPYFRLDDEDKLDDYINKFLSKPAELISLIETALVRHSQGKETLPVKHILKRFRFGWYQSVDRTAEVEALIEEGGSSEGKVTDLLTEDEVDENSKGPIYLHIFITYFNIKTEAGHIDSIRNPERSVVKYLDPADKKWKFFERDVEFAPYNTFIQMWQNTFLERYQPVYAIIVKITRIVDTCKRSIKGKSVARKGGQGVDARKLARGRDIESYPGEDTVHAIYNIAPDNILDNYRNKALKYLKKKNPDDDDIDDAFFDLGYVREIGSKKTLGYNPNNNFTIDRKLFLLGYYLTHYRSRVKEIRGELFDILNQTGHIVDLGLTENRYNTDPVALEREPCS